MKKSIVFVALGVALALGQMATAQISINAGYLSSSIRQRVTYAANQIDTTMTLAGGFYGGLSYNIKTNLPIGIEVGLYASYGSNNENRTIKQGPMETTVKSSITMLDLAVPLHISYKYDFTDDFSLVASVGPTLQVGLSGSQTASMKMTAMGMEMSSSEISGDLFSQLEGESGPYFTRFDIGLSLLAGVQFHGFRVQLGYTLGTLDRCGYTDGGNYSFDFHMGQLSAGIGYSF